MLKELRTESATTIFCFFLVETLLVETTCIVSLFSPPDRVTVFKPPLVTGSSVETKSAEKERERKKV